MVELSQDAEFLAAQWQRVAYWRDRLKAAEDYPVLDALNDTWLHLDKYYGGAINRDTIEKTASTPFAALFFLLDMGFYPPPELLMALMDAFDQYRDADGAITLEEVFFGPPRRKAGNYAQRRNRKFLRMWMGFEMHRLMGEGKTKMQAAELVSAKLGGKPEPETIMRTVAVPRITRKSEK